MRGVQWKVALVAFAYGGAIVALYAARNAVAGREHAESRVRELERELRSATARLAERDSALRVARLEFAPRERVEQRLDESRASFDVAVPRVEFLPAAPQLIEPVRPTLAVPVLRAEARVAMLPEREVPVQLAGSPVFAFRPVYPTMTGARPRGGASVFALAFAAGDGLNAWLHLDRDPGGYADTWSTMDKLAHGAMGALITQSALNIGVPRRWAAPITCAGAVGFEYSQGYVSWKDALAGCSGAVIATGIDWVAAEVRR